VGVFWGSPPPPPLTPAHTRPPKCVVTDVCPRRYRLPPWRVYGVALHELARVHHV